MEGSNFNNNIDNNIGQNIANSSMINNSMPNGTMVNNSMPNGSIDNSNINNNANNGLEENTKKKKNNKIIIVAAIVGVVVVGALLFILLNKKKEFIVTFDSSGGSTISSQTVIEGEKVVKPTDPTKENYNFIRWEYQNKEYDFTSSVESDMTLKAIWEEIKEEEQYYDIEFTVNGVTKKLSLSHITDADLETLGFEAKDGYEIVWYLNEQEFNINEPLTANVSLVGKYVKITLYTVKFNSDGGTSVSSQKVKPNERVTEPEAITRYGFIFDGWYLNKDKYDFNTPVTKNITLVAKWKEDENVKRYEVTFDSDGGSNVSKQRVIENEKAKSPKNPTRSGYKFIGWFLNDKAYDFKTKVTSNITLKAKWEKIIQYTVTFNKDNGSSNETKTVNSGDKVSKPTDPSKSGYKFTGWLYENKVFDFNTPITKDMTLTASYEKLATPNDSYTITATRADKYSPDSTLKVFKNGSQISVKEIKYSDGVHLCNGSNLVVGNSDIEGETTFIVVLNDGKEVRATLK